MNSMTGSKTGLMPVEEALAMVSGGLPVLPAQEVSIHEAVGRVLAEPIVARRSQPPAAMSAMDGYAVAAPDKADLPVRLTVIGESAAGRPFEGVVGPGQAVRIFTGGVVPEGADTVVIQENVTREGPVVVLYIPIAQGRNVRLAGSDFREGDVLLPAGCRLNGRNVMLAAAADHARLRVARRPRIGIIQTGDELVPPGAATGAQSEVVMSNAFGIAALARGVGAEVIDMGLVRDTMEATRTAIRRAAAMDLDVLVSSGGASVGEHDLMAPALREEGIELSVHKIALRPGKPLMFGARGRHRVLGLPGNPVSAYVCAALFLVPMLRRLQGEEVAGLPIEPALLGAALPANDTRMDFLRATITYGKDGVRHIFPLPTQDSAMLSILAAADCLLIRLPFAAPGVPGDPCEIIPLNA